MAKILKIGFLVFFDFLLEGRVQQTHESVKMILTMDRINRAYGAFLDP